MLKRNPGALQSLGRARGYTSHLCAPSLGLWDREHPFPKGRRAPDPAGSSSVGIPWHGDPKISQCSMACSAFLALFPFRLFPAPPGSLPSSPRTPESSLLLFPSFSQHSWVPSPFSQHSWGLQLPFPAFLHRFWIPSLSTSPGPSPSPSQHSGIFSIPIPLPLPPKIQNPFHSSSLPHQGLPRSRHNLSLSHPRFPKFL